MYSTELWAVLMPVLVCTSGPIHNNKVQYGFLCCVVCVVCVSGGVHKGLGEALQCIILLHLFYSSSPGDSGSDRDDLQPWQIWQRWSCSPLAGGAAPECLLWCAPDNPPFSTLIKLFIAFIELLIISHFQCNCFFNIYIFFFIEI